MKLSVKSYALALYGAVQGKKEGEIKIILKKFVETLAMNQNLSLEKKIISRFEDIWNKENRIVEASVKTSRKINNKTVALIEEFININGIGIRLVDTAGFSRP